VYFHLYQKKHEGALLQEEDGGASRRWKKCGRNEAGGQVKGALRERSGNEKQPELTAQWK